MATTVSAAACTVGKEATRVDGLLWAGISRRIARVTMPSVPSLPTNSFTRDSPATSLIRLPPRVILRSVGQHHVQPEHVVGGDPVLHTAQPAGIGGDVAADRADLVRGRVRRVPESVRGRCRLDLGVEGARLDHRDPGRDVDLDGPHPLQAEHDTAVDRGRAAGQAAAGPAGDQRHAVGGRPAYGRLYVVGVTGADHRDRRAGGRIPGPVEPVVLAGDGIGPYGVPDGFRQFLQYRLLQCSVHAATVASATVGLFR